MNLETMTLETLDYGVHLLTINNPPANTLNESIQHDLLKLLKLSKNDSGSSSACI